MEYIKKLQSVYQAHIDELGLTKSFNSEIQHHINVRHILATRYHPYRYKKCM